MAAHGSQETEDEYIALPKGRTPGAKNKRDELTPDQDSNGQADVSEEGIGLCKTQKTLALSPPAADYRKATSQAESVVTSAVMQLPEDIIALSCKETQLHDLDTLKRRAYLRDDVTISGQDEEEGYQQLKDILTQCALMN